MERVFVDVQSSAKVVGVKKLPRPIKSYITIA